MQLNSYVTFNGRCEEAFKFYETCLGGKIVIMLTHAGTPVDGQVPPEWRQKLSTPRWTWQAIYCRVVTLHPVIIKNHKAFL